MKNVSYKILIFLLLMNVQNVFAEIYEVPPTSTTYSSPPVISDEAMKACVKLYNKTKWLSEEIRSMHVDQYSQLSINAYNKKVDKHSKMTREFNIHCAGKQSRSAYEAAQKLNREKNGI
jgi:hypothetical protein